MPIGRNGSNILRGVGVQSPPQHRIGPRWLDPIPEVVRLASKPQIKPAKEKLPPSGNGEIQAYRQENTQEILQASLLTFQ